MNVTGWLRERRQAVVGGSMAVAALSLGGSAVKAAYGTASDTFAGVVQTTTAVDLNFQQGGVVTDLLVAAGDHVNRGQVLARENGTVFSQAVTADRTAIQADQAKMAELQDPTVGPAQKAEDQLKIQAAQQQLLAAQQSAATAAANAAAQVTRDQQAVAAEQALLNQVQAQIGAGCPKGPALPAAGAAQTLCATLQSQLAMSQRALEQDQNELAGTQSTAQEDAQADANAVTMAQTQVALATAEGAEAGTPATPADIAAAQAQLAKDQQQLANDVQMESDTTIVSPFDGTIAAVNGSIGTMDDQTGVRSYGSPAALVPTAPGFSLFQSTSQNLTSAGTDQYSALISVNSGTWRVVAQVPESSIAKVRLGQGATVSVPSAAATAPARVAAIEPTPVHVNNGVFYYVALQLTGRAPGRHLVLPGMTANITITGA